MSLPRAGSAHPPSHATAARHSETWSLADRECVFYLSTPLDGTCHTVTLSPPLRQRACPAVCRLCAQRWQARVTAQAICMAVCSKTHHRDCVDDTAGPGHGEHHDKVPHPRSPGQALYRASTVHCGPAKCAIARRVDDSASGHSDRQAAEAGRDVGKRPDWLDTV